MNDFVSICIPTYRQVSLLKENLESILIQSHQNFEVIVSDDSPDDAVEQLISSYANRLHIQYIRNRPALGSPANWNAVLKKAKGDYILLLHHDDQFSGADALQIFVQALQQNTDVDFAFGRNNGVERMAGGEPFPASYFSQYKKNPTLLVTANMFGVPSNIFFRNKQMPLYDERYKWIVDIEYYTRLLEQGRKFLYIDKRLIITGVHEGQVTNECIDDSEVILYENITYAIEHIPKMINVLMFDFYWRLLRNNSVKTITQLRNTRLKSAKLPQYIIAMINWQSKVSPSLLRNGVFSKTLMVSCYLSNRLFSKSKA